ncbi:MAG: hypothetical protein HETSPECPRED_005886 [Heterodermia speciosa]|uniref:Epoxide hydrolase n=1 Tax=Heterodermia speciosa TaxID=116794 RepID=A0A8H3FJE8_9LECA|nr:MAG: hypothetical protein HETSPECPRED_005886 [Heterodermia speciosa]
MPSQTLPKAVLFDIGGVCVASPFQAIIDYEQKNKIPADWVNFAISRSAPNGAWQRLERGEMKMDDTFFDAFNADLSNKSLWQEFNETVNQGKGKLKDAAMKNPSLLGDPVSLKAEQSNAEPTDQDKGSQSTSSIGQISSKKLSSEIPPEAPAPTMTSLSSSKEALTSENSQSKSLPQLPTIDGRALFWSMMDAARSPDPYIFPALLRLRSFPPEKRPILGALSNTVIFPPGHPYNRIASVPASSQSTPSAPSTSPSSQASVSEDSDPRSHFDIFVASAEVGLRKPDRKIYELAVQELDERGRQNGGSGIKAEDVVFLDDIGENLKTAKVLGMRTIKVQLGKTWRAVKELEGIINVELMDEKTRRSKL